MLILGLGGVLAALGATLVPAHYWLGLSVSALGFFAIGLGTGATELRFALLAKHVAPERKPAAAALVWFMMIIGFAVTAGSPDTSDPYFRTPARCH